MRTIGFILVVCLLPGSLLAAVEGTVITSGGTPVEHARVALEDGSEVGFSDAEGRFQFSDAEAPLELLVAHPRFVPQTVAVTEASELPLTVVLQPKQEVYEEIAVTANRGEESFAPVTVASSVIEPDDSPAPPATLTEMIAEVPAVAENGQGGIFQSYSIRGVSRQRVLTMVSGMRIVGERRAGVSASFVDPRLMSSVDVLRGPSSTFYGSGALGGVVQLFPRRFAAPAVELGYQSQGDEFNGLVGWGDDRWTLGLAHRQADDSETPNGDRLNSGFTQTSTVVQRDWESNRFRYQILGVGSLADDIGKANTDFPERTTTYPQERHLLLRFAMHSASNWSLEAWMHPNDLETRVVEEESRSDLANEAFDLGFNWQKRVIFGAAKTARFGFDYFGRRDVEALENTLDLDAGETTTQATLRNGEEDELGIYGAFEWNWGPAMVLAGGRAAWQQQSNADLPSSDEAAVTGFAGLVVPLGGGFEVVANLGSGLRFPSLSERFFSGVTGRGQVEGNPGLDPERSLNLDAGLRWYGAKLFVSAYVFRNEIDDYIERIEIEPNLLTFVNLTSGTIEGFELEGLYQIDQHWSLGFGGHLLDGEDDDRRPLADVPADRFFVSGSWNRGRWSSSLRWEERREKTDFGSGEKPIPGASLLSAALEVGLQNGLALTLSGRNLLDEEYFNAADRKTPISPGTSVGIGLRWRS
jgi:iron complex outermembrane receptor protein